MKIGVLGYGSIGKRHVKNLEALGHRCYVYDPENKMTTSRKHVMSEAEAIVIASPTARHRQDVLDVAAIGKPMFVEKPIGASNADWIALKEMTRKDRVFVGYNLRFLTSVKQAKELIGLKAPPVWARFTCSQLNRKDVYLRDGVILNWSHEIDLAQYLLGPAKVMTSYTRLTKDRDDLTVIVLQHDSGCITTVQLDYLIEPQVRGFVIVNNEHHITADLDRGTLLYEEAGQPLRIAKEDGKFDDCYLREMQAFTHFAGGGMMQGCTMDEALSVLDIGLRVREKAGLTI